MSRAAVTLSLRVVLTPMPTTWCYDPTTISVGLQHGKTKIVRGQRTTTSITFEAEVAAKQTPTGAPDFAGPFVHGKPGERFLYVSWGHADPDAANPTRAANDTHNMFRRLKLYLTPVTRKDWSAPGITPEQIRPGATLTTTVSGTCPDGSPNCGTGEAHWRSTTDATLAAH